MLQEFVPWLSLNGGYVSGIIKAGAGIRGFVQPVPETRFGSRGMIGLYTPANDREVVRYILPLDDANL